MSGKWVSESFVNESKSKIYISESGRLSSANGIVARYKEELNIRRVLH